MKTIKATISCKGTGHTGFKPQSFLKLLKNSNPRLYNFAVLGATDFDSTNSTSDLQWSSRTPQEYLMESDPPLEQDI